MKDLIAKFAEVERRVSTLASENRELRAAVRELEREVAALRGAEEELEQQKGKQAQVRDRLKRLLKSLDGIRREESAPPEATSASPHAAQP